MPEPKKVNLSEQGMTGLRYTEQGSINEEFLPKLQGKQGVKVFTEMRDNDPVVGSILFAIDTAIRQVTWDVTPNLDAEGRANDDAEFLRQCMEDMSHTWEDLVAEILTMVVFGFSLFEIVYKKREGPDGEHASDYDDGKIGWRKLATRSQDSIDHFEFDNKGGVKAVVQKPPPDYKDIKIPIEKLLLFRTTTVKGNPEGRSVLRNAYRPWFYKQRMEEIEAIGVERDLAGLPVAYVDAAILDENASESDKKVLEAIKKIVSNIKRDAQEGVVWPMVHDANGHQLYDLKLLSGGGSRTFDTSAIIDRYDKRIAQTVLADFIMLGQSGGQGSFALASSKTNLFAQALGAWLKNIEGVLNTFAVPRLFKVNGMEATHLPQIQHGDIEKPELAELGAYLNQLAAIGVPLFPNAELEEFLLDAASMPQPTEEEREEAEEQQGNEGGQAAMGPQPPADGQGGEQPMSGDQFAQELQQFQQG